MSINEFVRDLKKNAKANTELNQLYKKSVPESSIYMPVSQVFEKIYIFRVMFYICLRMENLNILLLFVICMMER